MMLCGCIYPKFLLGYGSHDLAFDNQWQDGNGEQKESCYYSNSDEDIFIPL